MVTFSGLAEACFTYIIFTGAFKTLTCVRGLLGEHVKMGVLIQ